MSAGDSPSKHAAGQLADRCADPVDSRLRGRKAPRAQPGTFVKTGTPADRAGPITASSDESTVLSPPIQIASRRGR